MHDFLTVGAAAPLQEAAVAGLEMPASYYEELQALYTERRDHFLAGLDRVGLKHNVPQGTYFVMIDISDFLALPQFKGWTDLQFCEWMIREVGVAAVPGSSFFREPVNHLIRMHFARGTDVLDEAVRRLETLQALLKLKQKKTTAPQEVSCGAVSFPILYTRFITRRGAARWALAPQERDASPRGSPGRPDPYRAVRPRRWQCWWQWVRCAYRTGGADSAR